MILRTATTLGLLAVLSLATEGLAQTEAPALQIVPDNTTPPAVDDKAAKTAEPAGKEAAKTEEPAVKPAPSVNPVIQPEHIAPGAPPVVVEEEWHIAIIPNGRPYPAYHQQPCPPELAGQPSPPNIHYYREIYEAIPFSRAEFEANPSYRHDATMEILFGYMRPTTIVRGPGNVGTSQYFPIQSPPVVPNPAWSPYGLNFGRQVRGTRFGYMNYFPLGYGPFYP